MTRSKFIFLVGCAIAAGLSLASTVQAAEPVVAELTAGYTNGEIRLEDGFLINVRNGAVTLPARVSITPNVALPTPLPSRYSQAGTVYGLAIDSAADEASSALPLWLKIPSVPVANTSTLLLGYNSSKAAWENIGETPDAGNILTGSTRQLSTIIVPVTDLATKPAAYGPEILVTTKSTVVEILPTSVTQNFIISPYTVTVRAQALPVPATFILTPNVPLPAPLPARYKQRAGVLQVALPAGDGTLQRANKGIVITPKISGNGFHPQRVLFYNPRNSKWEVTKSNTVYVMGYAVVVDDLNEEVGIASWYKSKKNPDGVAHNGFPMGTKLKVTNVENGKSTVVRVVSRGPYVRGRVVDLVYTAFKKIKSSNGGLARVTVAALDPKVLGDTVSVPAVVPADTSSTAPVTLPVSSTAGVAYDVEKGLVIAGKNVDEKHPIASLTKLMTALVYLDRNPSFKNIVTYQKSDGAICSCLYVSPGETMTANDLWHAMLIGSANNATRALARSTKLTENEFVKLMNAKAKALGLNSLTFADPTGLDPANQGSAQDMAKLAAIAFSKSEIANVAVKESYTFSTRNTKKAHTIKNRNKMLETGWQVTGIKTGYIEESGNCLITQVKGKTTGRTIVTVVLGAASAAKQYEDTEKALSIGFANIK